MKCKSQLNERYDHVEFLTANMANRSSQAFKRSATELWVLAGIQVTELDSEQRSEMSCIIFWRPSSVFVALRRLNSSLPWATVGQARLLTTKGPQLEEASSVGIKESQRPLTLFFFHFGVVSAVYKDSVSEDSGSGVGDCPLAASVTL
jgi:hypothetical protein